MSPICKTLGRLSRRFASTEDGAVLVMTVIGIALFVAMGGLAIDFGRMYNTHTQLQAYADHVALAAAAELDGEAGAIERARQAALGPLPDGTPEPLLTDAQNFATGAPELAIIEPVFLSALPPDPLPQSDMSDLAPYVTTEDGEAQFVHVTVQPRQVDFLLLPIMKLFLGRALAAGDAAQVSATAVAGFTREVCNFPPLMMCNPYETATNKSFTPIIGQQILLKTKGAGSAWVPGDFGLLDTVEGAGAGVCTGGLGGTNRIRCVMALINPNSSCVAGNVNIRPGQASSVHAGLNVRFDIWDPPLQTKKGDPMFAPSANVTKGMRHNPNQCAMNQLEPAPDTVALPRDPCFATGTCEGGRFGDGVTTAQLQGYWNQNHPGTGGLPGALTGGTRYDVYRHEIDNDQIPVSTDPNGETGHPSCAPSGINNPLRDRRTLIVAIINCLEHNVQGSTDNVPVVAFGQMFMTEPVGGSPDTDLYAEMLGVLDPGGDDGVLHDFPQLYR